MLPERAAYHREAGFTLIELLIVLVIIGVLLAIAVPSYLGFRGRAADDAARANIRSAFPAATAYGTDNTGTPNDADADASTSGFEGLTVARLRGYDAGIAGTLSVHIAKNTTTGFCLSSTESGRSWSAPGPGLSGFLSNTTCS